MTGEVAVGVADFVGVAEAVAVVDLVGAGEARSAVGPGRARRRGLAFAPRRGAWRSEVEILNVAGGNIVLKTVFTVRASIRWSGWIVSKYE